MQIMYKTFHVGFIDIYGFYLCYSFLLAILKMCLGHQATRDLNRSVLDFSCTAVYTSRNSPLHYVSEDNTVRSYCVGTSNPNRIKVNITWTCIM